MSRSYKHTPVVKDGCDKAGAKKYRKRQANKKLRKIEDLGSGKSRQYRKAFESWDICDYRFYEERRADMDEEERGFWERAFYRK